MPGFKIGPEGFKSRGAGADTFQFDKPTEIVRGTGVTAKGGRWGLKGGAAERLTIDLRSPGFELKFASALSLRLTALNGPYLTVKDSSFGPGVPSAPSPWTLLTFADNQPAVLIVALDRSASLTVEGNAGDWTLKGPPGDYRFCLPFGLSSVSGHTAATLGELAAKVESHAKFWTGRTPKLLSQERRSRPGGLTVIWTYDRPGAIVTPAVALAKIGGYPVKLLTGAIELEAPLESGPTVVATEAKVSVQFPISAIPGGRAVVPPFNGWPQTFKPGAEGTVTKSLIALFHSGPQAPWLAELERAESLETSLPADPFAPSDLPLDELAGLVVARSVADKGSDRRALLKRLLGRREEVGWEIKATDLATGRRATALLALSGCLSEDLDAQTEAVLSQAALSASLGRGKFCEKRGFPFEAPSEVEPLLALRKRVFSLSQACEPDPGIDSLYSPCRVEGPIAMSSIFSRNRLQLAFSARAAEPVQLKIWAPVAPVLFAASNLTNVGLNQEGPAFVFRAIGAQTGLATVWFDLPGYEPKPLVPWFAYSE